MAIFKLPLSGDFSQWIAPVTSWWSGNQVSINLGESGSPDAEAEALPQCIDFHFKSAQFLQCSLTFGPGRQFAY